jgi:hypothetical protein
VTPVLLLEHRDVELDLFVQVVVEAASVEESTETKEPSHKRLMGRIAEG